MFSFVAPQLISFFIVTLSLNIGYEHVKLRVDCNIDYEHVKLN